MSAREAAMAVLAGLFLVLLLEGLLRLVGLGQPVLALPDPALEYRLAPNQDVMRWGRRIVINGRGMRGPDHPAAATAEGEEAATKGAARGHRKLIQHAEHEESMAHLFTRRRRAIDRRAQGFPPRPDPSPGDDHSAVT